MLSTIQCIHVCKHFIVKGWSNLRTLPFYTGDDRPGMTDDDTAEIYMNIHGKQVQLGICSNTSEFLSNNFLPSNVTKFIFYLRIVALAMIIVVAMGIWI